MRYVPALRRHELTKLREPAAVRERPIDSRDRGLGVVRFAAADEHLGARRARQLDQVRRSMAPERCDGLGDLEAIADRAAQWLLHVGELTRDR